MVLAEYLILQVKLVALAEVAVAVAAALALLGHLLHPCVQGVHGLPLVLLCLPLVAVGVEVLRPLLLRQQTLVRLEHPILLSDKCQRAVVVTERWLRHVAAVVGDRLAPADASLVLVAAGEGRVVEGVVEQLAAAVGEATESLNLERLGTHLRGLAAVLAVGPHLASRLLGGQLLGLDGLGLHLDRLQLGLGLLDRVLAAEAVGVHRVLQLGLTGGHFVRAGFKACSGIQGGVVCISN